MNIYIIVLVIAKRIAEAASRALGLLIAKDKALGRMPYKGFSKCFDAIVQSTLNYGAPIYMGARSNISRGGGKPLGGPPKNL